jgi:hypothetical protein
MPKTTTTDATFESYSTEDAILAVMKLPSPCAIRIEVLGDQVKLFIGQRDWAWSRETGYLLGAGTAFNRQF